MRVWNEKGEVSAWSQPTSFTTGIFGAWLAKWLRGNAGARNFSVTGHVESAVLHITGVGFYESYLNGKRIGKKVLDPSPTAYDKRVLYSTYHVEDLLKCGDNELKVIVGHGWYDVRVPGWDCENAPWKDRPCFKAELVVRYSDGSLGRVVTDETWRSVGSPVAYDDIREGEVIAGVMSAPGSLEVVRGPKGRLVPEIHPGAEIVREISPVALTNFPGGVCVMDFGEDMAGWIRMVMRGLRSGDMVSVRYDERVGPNMQPTDRRCIDMYFSTSASTNVCTRDAGFQTDRYIARGDAEEVYEPRFTYNGFRYVVVRGLREPLQKDCVRGCLVRTAFPVIGEFTCSNQKLNCLVRMCERAYCSNFTDGYPTDCPHREKNGWTGDAWFASELAQYFFENTAAYEKFINDMLDAQLPDGNVPAIVPSAGWGIEWGNGPAWDVALAAIPWNLWIYRGDRQILDVVYPALLKYLSFAMKKMDDDGLVSHGLGDWNAVNPKHMPETSYTSSCCLLQAMRIAAEIAGLKSLDAEKERLANSAFQLRSSIRKRFSRGNGVFANGGQTAQAFALAYGLVDQDERQECIAKLVESVERADGHVDMGVLGMKTVFRELSRAGRSDLAIQMLTNEIPPSPWEWAQKGGTSLWEDWKDGESRNHIMFGDFAAWAFQYLAGIRPEVFPESVQVVQMPVAAGLKRFVVDPDYYCGLKFVRAKTESPHGEISVTWDVSFEAVVAHVVVPSGSVALVHCPDGEWRRVTAGRHQFSGRRKR